MNCNFRSILAKRQKDINSLVCVGLDPLLENTPQNVLNSCTYAKWEHVPLDEQGSVVDYWMRGVVDATAPYASMFKPQRAHWEALGGGADALKRIIAYIHKTHPEIPVFLDCKRGDIDRTQRQYREAHFTLDGADGINYNGYMGEDTLKDLVNLDHPGRALVGLGRTSNPNAWKVQDRLLADGRKVWEAMVQDIHDWSLKYGVLNNAGIVMGAAHKDPSDPAKIYSGHLEKVREMFGDQLWFLIPGIGTQGGFIKATVHAAYMGHGTIAINSSSGIIFAVEPGVAVCQLRDDINASLATIGY